MWFIISLFVVSVAPLAILITYPSISKYTQIALTSVAKERVDKQYEQLILILASMLTDDWLISGKTAKYPKEGSYRFYVDLSDKLIRIPGDVNIHLSEYWFYKFNSFITDRVSDQNRDTIIRHLFPDGKLKLLK